MHDIYTNRICRRRDDGEIDYYASKKLGALGTNLAAISWFFEEPYETPIATLTGADQSWVLSQAARGLIAQGRVAEALRAERAGLGMDREAKNWDDAAISASNLSQAELLVGDVAAAVATAEQSVSYADRSGGEFEMMTERVRHADALHAAGRREDSEGLFADAEQRQKERQPVYPLLYALQGYQYCDLLLERREWTDTRNRASQTLELGRAAVQSS